MQYIMHNSVTNLKASEFTDNHHNTKDKMIS